MTHGAASGLGHIVPDAPYVPQCSAELRSEDHQSLNPQKARKLIALLSGMGIQAARRAVRDFDGMVLIECERRLGLFRNVGRLSRRRRRRLAWVSVGEKDLRLAGF